MLKGVDVVVFDEFHERGVGGDVALALVREVQKGRLEGVGDGGGLGIVVMSATLLGDVTKEEEEVKGKEDGTNANDSSSGGEKEPSAAVKLLHTLGGTDNCGILRSDGRQFPIDILWANQLSKSNNQRSKSRFSITPLGMLLRDRKAFSETMCHAILQGLARAPGGGDGDVLAFLPGVAEIRRVVRLLQEQQRTTTNISDDVEILPLYGALPKDQQDCVIFPPPTPSHKQRRRRIIVSSPISEASLTLPHVTTVIDSGLHRTPHIDQVTGLPTLRTVR